MIKLVKDYHIFSLQVKLSFFLANIGFLVCYDRVIQLLTTLFWILVPAIAFLDY